MQSERTGIPSREVRRNTKWLAVVLEDIPDIQLMQHFGPNSRMQPPTLDGIAFDYLDEVWVVSERGDVVLRLSDGGRQVSITHL